MEPDAVDIGGFSFSHHNTTLEERDMLALSSDEIARAIPEFRARVGGEVGILSTCNRTEFYVSGPAAHDPWEATRLLLADVKEVRAAALPRPSRLNSRGAAAHLFRVAASLESVALGEDQILAQVKAAHELILSGPGKSPVLDQLFRMAVRSGKQVRTETTLCRGNVSISSV